MSRSGSQREYLPVRDIGQGVGVILFEPGREDFNLSRLDNDLFWFVAPGRHDLIA